MYRISALLLKVLGGLFLFSLSREQENYLSFGRIEYVVTERCFDHWVKQAELCPCSIPSKQSEWQYNCYHFKQQ
jgi:hypothetical protein